MNLRLPEQGGGTVRELGMDMHTLLYLKQMTITAYCKVQGALLHVTWQPEWEGVWRRAHARICLAEAFRRSPETVTVLLIGYTPMQGRAFRVMYQRVSGDTEVLRHRFFRPGGESGLR